MVSPSKYTRTHANVRSLQAERPPSTVGRTGLILICLHFAGGTKRGQEALHVQLKTAEVNKRSNHFPASQFDFLFFLIHLLMRPAEEHEKLVMKLDSLEGISGQAGNEWRS